MATIGEIRKLCLQVIEATRRCEGSPIKMGPEPVVALLSMIKKYHRIEIRGGRSKRRSLPRKRNKIIEDAKKIGLITDGGRHGI